MVPAGVAGCASQARPAVAPSGRDSAPSPASAVRGEPALPAVLPPEIATGPTDVPAVALTFHGQGDPVLANRLLDEVATGGARITVLAVGSWLDAQPETARRILHDGHELGNHTQNHLALASLPPEAVHTEIAACADGLRRLTGSIGTWFRPSQTRASTPVIRDQAAKVGYRTVLSYDLDSLDYTDPPPAEVVSTVLGAAHPGAVVSLHLGHPVTVTALPAILAGLRQRGLRPVTMTELMAP